MSKWYHLPQWGLSRGNKNIELFHSHGAMKADSRPLLLIGGVHGDEPQGVALVRDTLQWVQALDRHPPWIIIPCLNPDGYAINERVNAGGVDLNRNFPAPDWTHETKAPRYYPGPHPGSEPEVRGLVELIEMVRPHLIVHCHSWQPCVVYTGKAAQPISNYIGQISGTPVSEDIGYPTPGSLGQFGAMTHHIPVICIEADEKAEPSTIWSRYERGMKALFIGVP